MLPIVATLLANGLSLIGNAVMAKGKDVIEEKLGVKLDEMVASPETVLELKKLELSHQQFLTEAVYRERQLSLEADSVDNANTASARTMNETVQNSDQASRVAKNAAYIIDFFIISMTVFLVGVILFQEIPAANKEVFYTAFGSLLAMCGTILNFHRGTSARSHGKDDTINDLINKPRKRSTDV